MKEDKLLKVLLGLLIFLVIHNFYLTYKLNQVENLVIYARNSASSAESYASEALDYAREAAELSSDAAYNAFGNKCRYCP